MSGDLTCLWCQAIYPSDEGYSRLFCDEGCRDAHQAYWDGGRSDG